MTNCMWSTTCSWANCSWRWRVRAQMAEGAEATGYIWAAVSWATVELTSWTDPKWLWTSAAELTDYTRADISQPSWQIAASHSIKSSCACIDAMRIWALLCNCAHIVWIQCMSGTISACVKNAAVIDGLGCAAYCIVISDDVSSPCGLSSHWMQYPLLPIRSSHINWNGHPLHRDLQHRMIIKWWSFRKTCLGQHPPYAASVTQLCLPLCSALLSAALVFSLH